MRYRGLLPIALAIPLITGLTAQPAVDRDATDERPEPIEIRRAGFVPSGWMGDGIRNGLRLTSANGGRTNPPHAVERWEYLPVPNGDGWAAIVYQFPENNWGDKDGKNLAAAAYRELSFWARGEADSNGRYPTVQFKAGGGSMPSKRFQASFEAATEFLTLTGEWKRYSISLENKDLSRVIAALTLLIRAEDNPIGAVFYLDGCVFQ
jgi:hypothetical protein